MLFAKRHAKPAPALTSRHLKPAVKFPARTNGDEEVHVSRHRDLHAETNEAKDGQDGRR